MKFRCLIVLAVLGAVLLGGCAETKVYKSYRDEIDSWSYGQRVGIVFKDWGLDLVDVFSLEAGAGECLGLSVMPTEFLQTGVYFGHVMKCGFRDRTAGYYLETRKEGGMSWFFYRDMIMTPVVGTASLMDETYRPRLVQGFPIRDNKEWHYLDFGGEMGLVFFDMSAHASPKQFLDLAVNTVSLPFELTVRPLFHAMGVRLPEIDFCDDDTAARLRKKYDVELIYHPDGLPPIEYFNERMQQSY